MQSPTLSIRSKNLFFKKPNAPTSVGAFSVQLRVSVFLRQFGDLANSRVYVFVAVFRMRYKTVRAILYTVLYIHEISSAFVPQRKQRAAAIHTVEGFTRGFMTRKILARLVFKIFIAVFHINHLYCFHYIKMKQKNQPIFQNKKPTSVGFLLFH